MITKLLNYFFLKFHKPDVSYKGDYISFSEASNICKRNDGGYDTDVIFNKVKTSTLAVKAGQAKYERDSVLFYDNQKNYNLIMYLALLARKTTSLNILDFGGALGSTYFQHKDIISELNCNWTIIEQNHYVAFGKENLESNGLHFCYSENLESLPKYDCVLFSSVLQYLENSSQIITSICRNKPSYIIVERTPVYKRKIFLIETVHEPIYEALCPCCVFCENDFIKSFTSSGYEFIDSWHSLVDGDVPFENSTIVFKSFIFKLI